MSANKWTTIDENIIEKKKVAKHWTVWNPWSSHGGVVHHSGGYDSRILSSDPVGVAQT